MLDTLNTLNRTIVELKFTSLLEPAKEFTPLNRTIVKLKFYPGSLHCFGSPLLIVLS